MRYNNIKYQHINRRPVAMTDMMHLLVRLPPTPNNFAIYGQKHKVWIFIFLVRISGTL